MDYCRIHFGKGLNDLNWEDVENFFKTERIESDVLEFKSFGGKLEQSYSVVIRSICAFLNSKGGLLVWGAPRGTRIAGSTERSFIGSLSPINSPLTKDQLISRIVDSIAPLPDDVGQFHT